MRHSDDPIRTLADLIDGIHFAMLTTATADGTLHARPMAACDRRFDGDLWFLSGRSSHKVEDILARPQVNVAFADPERQAYISVVGHAELVDDLERKHDLWRPAHLAWFPGGVEDPELTLLRVRVSEADVWTSPSSAMVKIAGFLHTIATGQPANLGQHDHVSLPV